MLDELTVEPGQRVVLSGTPVRVGASWCLVHPEGEIRRSDDAQIRPSLFTPLVLDARTTDLTHAALRDSEWGSVDLEGLLRVDGGVLVDDHSRAVLSTHPPVRPRPFDRPTAGTAATVARRPDAEARLMASGALLDSWDHRTDAGTTCRIALAADPELVEARLKPIHGPRLRVVASRHAARVLRDLSRTILESGLARRIGTSVTPDHQMRVQAFVAYLSPSLADSLAEFPRDAYDLHVMARPLGA